MDHSVEITLKLRNNFATILLEKFRQTDCFTKKIEFYSKLI